MVQAYVLITATIGKVRQVARDLGKISSVKSVHAVTGPYDIIVFIEAKSLDALSSIVVERIHKVKGVVDTNTAIVVEI
jgi:DNA-binding Lrp family transcriptional regulator